MGKVYSMCVIFMYTKVFHKSKFIFIAKKIFISSNHVEWKWVKVILLLLTYFFEGHTIPAVWLIWNFTYNWSLDKQASFVIMKLFFKHVCFKYIYINQKVVLKEYFNVYCNWMFFCIKCFTLESVNTFSAMPGLNLAFEKRTRLKTGDTRSSGLMAVDGDGDTCASTKIGMEGYLEIDLGISFYVADIVLVNSIKNRK